MHYFEQNHSITTLWFQSNFKRKFKEHASLTLEHRVCFLLKVVYSFPARMTFPAWSHLCCEALRGGTAAAFSEKWPSSAHWRAAQLLQDWGQQEMPEHTDQHNWEQRNCVGLITPWPPSSVAGGSWSGADAAGGSWSAATHLLFSCHCYSLPTVLDFHLVS